MADDDLYLIKRYSNRKLYDSVRRRFTTLDEIAGLLDTGVRVVVRDHDGGTDRTDEVLAQVLRRRVQSRPGSSNFLADLLRAPTDVAQNVVGLAEPLARTAGVAGGHAATDAAGTAGGKTTAAKPKKATKKAKTKQHKAKDTDLDPRDAEMRELREQVSQLTQAVTLLLQEKTGDVGPAEPRGAADD